MDDGTISGMTSLPNGKEAAMRNLLALLSVTVVTTATFAIMGCCSYPVTRTFGIADNFAAVPADPVPYSPAFPPFVTFLNNNGVTTANMTTFDALTADHHMVATLRHGLRGCFPGATSLNLCFRARALAGQPDNDGVVIYNTNLTNNTFQIIYNSAIKPTLIASWNTSATATLCIDLTSQMMSGQIGDMLQFKVQDDTAVDHITMTLQ
jgi:hypothetical protein